MSNEAKSENATRHNVGEPEQLEYHRPPIVKHPFADRFVACSTSQNVTHLAWVGYDPSTTLDHIYYRPISLDRHTQEPQGEKTQIVSSHSGCYGRPCVAAGPQFIDVLWIADGSQLMHVRRCDGELSPPAIVSKSQSWRRDLAACAGQDSQRFCCWCESSTDQNDTVEVWSFRNNEWQPAFNVVSKGAVARPSIVEAEGHLHLAFDEYLDGRYNIRFMSWDGNAITCEQTVESEHHLLLPRLTVDANGNALASVLAETIVERNHVIGRADSIRLYQKNESCWQLVKGDDGPDAVKLYHALLPKRTYFGYQGLRRNPFVVPVADGAIYLVWEAQRDEEEIWDNIDNGWLMARRYDSQGWGPIQRWHDGDCCFDCDHQAIQDPHAIACLHRTRHQSDSSAFQLFTVDPSTVVDVFSEDAKAWQDWKPYQPKCRPQRQHLEHDGQRLTLYFGDFHNHSIHSSDAEGYPDELYHFARDVAGVDFSGITDNDYYPAKPLLASEIHYTQSLVQGLDQPESFLPFSGYEWTFHRDDEEHSYNHRSIVYTGEQTPIVRRNEPDGWTEEAFRNRLTEMPVFAHAHHGQYELLNTAQEANVEIASAWQMNIEKTDACLRELNRGKIFGFIAGTDSHRMVPGLACALTAVWATGLTREAIIDALLHRRCYATSGNRTMIDLRINGHLMGSVLNEPSERRFTIRVASERPLVSVQLIFNGAVVSQWNPNAETFETEWCDKETECGWYYLRVEDDTPYREHPHNVSQAVGPLAWSSPVWVRRT